MFQGLGKGAWGIDVLGESLRLGGQVAEIARQQQAGSSSTMLPFRCSGVCHEYDGFHHRSEAAR